MAVTAPLLDITPSLRESVTARIAERRGEAAAKYWEADLLMEQVDDVRRAAIRLEHEADALADKLRELERESDVSDTRLAPAEVPGDDARGPGPRPSHK